MAALNQLRRDVGQLLWVGFQGNAAPDYLLRLIGAGKVGGVIIFKRNLRLTSEVVTYAGGTAGAAPDVGGNSGLVSQALTGELAGAALPEAAVTRELFDVDALVDLNRTLHAAASAEPLLVAVDQEGGRVQRIRAPATLWPPMLGFDGFDDEAAEELARAVGKAMGDELAALGFDVDFAPVLDVHTNPDNPIIGNRAFATTAERAARRALALAAGLGSAGIIACGKHFPGHGDTSTDSHLELPRIDHDRARLDAIELLPFLRAAAAGLPMIMTAHIVFAAVAPEIPATLSYEVVTGLLREQLGYRGLVVSDDLDMRAISRHYRTEEAAVAAVTAGCDALLLCCDTAAQRQAYEGLVRAGERDSEFRARLGRAAQSVRDLKRAHFAGDRAESAGAARQLVGAPAHQALARRLAGR